MIRLHFRIIEPSNSMSPFYSMKLSMTAIFAWLLLFLSCGNPAKDKMISEASLYISDFTNDKMKEIEPLYNDCIREGRGTEGLDELGKLHRVCKQFYSGVDSIRNLYRELPANEVQDYPFIFIDSLYRLTTDSMLVWMSEEFLCLKRNDYSKPPHVGSAMLTLSRMKYDILTTHVAALEFQKRKGNRFLQNYPDDGSGLATTRFPSQAHQYSFSVSNKFLQQFPYREIIIDAITRDGQPVTTTPLIDNRDLVRLVELHGLRKGKYFVRIGLGRNYFISHRFQIK